MGWKGVTVMDQRVSFISEYLKNYFPFSELCLEFNISRKTGHKWVSLPNQSLHRIAEKPAPTELFVMCVSTT